MDELTYSGTAKGFLKFIDPFLRNTVQNMTRKVKKHTTCRHPNCNKRKYLEAAHTKFTRPEIISKILNEHFECEENMYTVNLEEFEKLFKEAHEPIEEVIQPMCRQHHIEYDKNKKIPTEYPVLLNTFETDEELNESYSIENLEELIKKEEEEFSVEMHKLNEIRQFKKSEVVSDAMKKYGIIDKSSISYSRISNSNGMWNFDVEKTKFKNDLYLIFFNQKTAQYEVAMIPANELPIDSFLIKDKTKIRLVINNNFEDRSCSFSFKRFIL